jgi:formamidopyrimidine-DNA glycosylase
MPELPDLEAIREFLAPRIAGVPIEAAEVRRPLVVRNLLGGGLAEQLVGRRFVDVGRRGKFLLLPLDSEATLVVNPMLAGRIRYGEPLPRHRTRDALVVRTADVAQVPTFADQGPEATDPDLTLEKFCQRLRRHNGEIKGILTNQAFVAGIGNAYADEILWRAGIYPFRRRPSLSEEEVAQLHAAIRAVLSEAIDTLRERVGEAIDVEIRDFLAIHGKAGQPCPRCGTPVSEVTRQRRSTSFCRACQPGLMVGGRGRALP